MKGTSLGTGYVSSILGDEFEKECKTLAAHYRGLDLEARVLKIKDLYETIGDIMEGK